MPEYSGIFIVFILKMAVIIFVDYEYFIKLVKAIY
jgi:hypothetical protein